VKTTTIWIVAALLWLAAPGGVSADVPQTLPSPSPYRQIVAEALQNNGELRALRQELESFAAAQDRSGLHPDPVLDVDVESGALTGSRGENRYSVGISREFLTFGKKGLRRSVAGRELEAAQARVNDAERLLAFHVKESLFALLLAREKAQSAATALELDRELVRIAQERFAAGEIAEVEVDLAEVEAVLGRERFLSAEREEALQHLNLSQLMGLSPGEMPEVPGGLTTAEVTLDPDRLTDRALRERPDLRALALDREAGETALRLARAEGLPNVTAGLSYSHERETTELRGVRERSSDNLLGVSLSVPLPTSVRRQSLVREAGARRGAAQERLSTLRASVPREVQRALHQLQGAAISVRLYREEIVPRLEANLATVQEAYRLGETGILNVIEEQRKFQQASGAYLQALHDWNLALAQLEAAVGSDLSSFEGDRP
jgi:outer membrane protein, heavy metal efflux system